ncbi:MAG: TIGR03749 family integrating conjugative element protein [Gammaproteobacteria bacterium]|nr:TIGR03749 family integrating conjugative element protein [Gammaproteobacteria bacterium]MDE0612299.1 TIGR03749 family integrating conjugative element protein [Gammaproteobacteria bacterium]
MKQLLALSLWLVSLPALGVSSLVYVGDPLPVLLPVGKERRIEIEGAREVRVGLSESLRKRLGVESAGPHVWLTAQDTLFPQRVYLETETGLLVLVIRTDPRASAEPLSIAVDLSGSQNSPVPPSEKSPNYVDLARYAIQALYAPDHREEPIRGIRRTPVDEQPVALFRCRDAYPSACGGAVESVPHTAWEAQPYYVTAVTIRNRLSEPLELDPRDIRGRFVASTIVHPYLEAAGSLRDATTVVLISRIPFGQAQ